MPIDPDRHPFKPLRPQAFDKLIERSATNRDRMISENEILLVLPPPSQVPDGQWRDRMFLPFDATLFVTAATLKWRGCPRPVVTGALELLQVELLAHIDRDGVWAGLVKLEPEGFQVMLGMPTEIKDAANLLALPNMSAAWFVPLDKVKQIIRERADQHDITLPSRFTLEDPEAMGEVMTALGAHRGQTAFKQHRRRHKEARA